MKKLFSFLFSGNLHFSSAQKVIPSKEFSLLWEGKEILEKSLEEAEEKQAQTVIQYRMHQAQIAEKEDSYWKQLKVILEKVQYSQHYAALACFNTTAFAGFFIKFIWFVSHPFNKFLHLIVPDYIVFFHLLKEKNQHMQGTPCAISYKFFFDL